jgi:lysozyme family protein
MPPKKTEAPSLAARSVNFSVRLSADDAKRVEAIAKAHDWPLAKTLQKLIIAALDARLVK